MALTPLLAVNLEVFWLQDPSKFEPCYLLVEYMNYWSVGGHYLNTVQYVVSWTWSNPF